MSRIALVFDHPPCDGVEITLTVPLPDPIQEGADALAARYLPACPLCKEPARYVGFHLDAEEDLDRSTRDHAPLFSLDMTRVLGCSCGWRTPPGTEDSDAASAAHVASARVVEGGDR